MYYTNYTNTMSNHTYFFKIIFQTVLFVLASFNITSNINGSMEDD